MVYITIYLPLIPVWRVFRGDIFPALMSGGPGCGAVVTSFHCLAPFLYRRVDNHIMFRVNYCRHFVGSLLCFRWVRAGGGGDTLAEMDCGLCSSIFYLCVLK